MYRAIINGNTFFDTSIDDDRYTLLGANVTKQKGGSGQFSFTVPCCNACYGMFGGISDYVDLYRDDETDPFFFGRVYSTNRRFDNALEVVCEGMLSVLCDTIFDPITHDGNLHTLVQLLLNSHNSQVEAAKRIYVGTLYVDNDACYRAYENYETTWERFEDLLQSFGGFLYLYRQNGTMYIDWKKTCDTDSTQKVDFGENLIDVQKYQNSNLICTVLTPLGVADKDNKRLDISSVNAGSKKLYADEEYIEKYGYIHKVQIWDDVTVASNLKTKGQSYMESCLAEQYTISITAVDLADAGYDIDYFDVGQKLKVTSIPNGIDGVFFDVNTLSKNLFMPEVDTLSIGTEFVGYVQMRNNSIHNLTLDLEKNYPTKSAVESATQLITGNKGGYVIMHDGDDDGYPDEILIMDTSDIDTAQKVWRWNNSGLGYSNTGYDGTFGLAMTIDGKIIGSYLQANSITADKINIADLFTQNITATNFHLRGGSVNIRTDTSEYDMIELTYYQYPDTYSALYAPSRLRFTHTYKDSWGTDGMTDFGHGGFTVDTKVNNSWGADAWYGTHSWGLKYNHANRVECNGQNWGSQLRFYNQYSTISITLDGTGGNITATGTIQGGSDRRLKDDICLLDNAKSADFVHNMKPSSFKYNADPHGYHHGFIAQDIEELLMRVYGNDSWKVVGQPDSEGDGMRYKTLAYMELLADIVATIQTHNERIKALETA